MLNTGSFVLRAMKFLEESQVCHKRIKVRQSVSQTGLLRAVQSQSISYSRLLRAGQTSQ